MLVKVEELSKRPLAGPAVPHVGDPRDRDAGRPGRASPASPATSTEYLAQKFPTSTAARLRRPRGRRRQRGHLRRAGPVLGDRPPAAAQVRRSKTYKPDLALVGFPATDEFQHQFLGLVTKTLPNGAANPAYDDVKVNGIPDHRVSAARRRSSGAPTQGADATMRARPQADGPRPDHVRRLRPRLRAAVPGDRRQQGARRPRPAVEAADLQLPPGRRARRSARPRPAGPAAPCRST